MLTTLADDLIDAILNGCTTIKDFHGAALSCRRLGERATRLLASKTFYNYAADARIMSTMVSKPLLQSLRGREYNMHALIDYMKPDFVECRIRFDSQDFQRAQMYVAMLDENGTGNLHMQATVRLQLNPVNLEVYLDDADAPHPSRVDELSGSFGFLVPGQTFTPGHGSEGTTVSGDLTWGASLVRENGGGEFILRPISTSWGVNWLPMGGPPWFRGEPEHVVSFISVALFEKVQQAVAGDEDEDEDEDFFDSIWIRDCQDLNDDQFHVNAVEAPGGALAELITLPGIRQQDKAFGWVTDSDNGACIEWEVDGQWD